MSEQTTGLRSSSPSHLPDKPSAEFLRKLAKDRLREMRNSDTNARLYQAQLQVAREHGFPSWRDLAAHLNDGQRGNVMRRGDRVTIEGIAPLTWSGSDCTYIAAMANVLRVIGPAHDYVRLMGDSSLAFRIRLWADDALTASCPSSPVGEMSPWSDFTERSIGWTMRWENSMSEIREAPVDATDRLDEVTASIDAGLPVLGFFKAWDMGIAYGYENGKLLVRDYHAACGEALMDMTECRGLFGFFDQRVSVPSQEQSARRALAEAVSRWSHPPDRTSRPSGEGAYYYGSDAYDRWIALLERAGSLTQDQRQSLLHVNYWTFISLHDARQKAAPYLRSIADSFPSSASALTEAAATYERIGELTGLAIHEGSTFMPFYKPDSLEKWTPDVRQREIETLSEVRPMDEQAIKHLATAAKSMTAGGAQ